MNMVLMIVKPIIKRIMITTATITTTIIIIILTIIIVAMMIKYLRCKTQTDLPAVQL